ncbi:MAG: hypothetical protein NC388_09970 [Clostridium sp.]|nr:hypothetical protein [Clostridium sp.]
MYKARIIIGVTAFATVIGLNIRHALNDYGITENAWIQTALATVDSVQSMKLCGEENGQPKYCHSRSVEKPGLADCDHYFTIIKAEAPTSIYNGKIQGTKVVELQRFDEHDTRGWVYDIPDFSDMYLTQWDIEHDFVINKIIEGTISVEYHHDTETFQFSSNDCIPDPITSCVPEAGVNTACEAAYGYATN